MRRAAALLGTGAAASLALAAAARGLSPRRGRMLALPDGSRARVLAAPGAGTGPRVVMVHGLGGAADNFAPVLPHLDGLEALAVERAGAGRTPAAPPGGAGLAAQAARVAAVIEATGDGGPALVVGHSLGGAVALQLAADRPDLVAGLVLVAALTRPDHAGAARLFGSLGRAALPRELLAHTLLAPGVALAGPFLMHMMFAPDRVPPGFLRRGGGLLALQPRALSGLLRDLEVVSDGIGPLAPRLPGLRMPVTILHASEDHVLDPAIHALPLAAALPQAALISPPGGHMLPVTRPRLVAAVIRAAAAQLEAAPARP